MHKDLQSFCTLAQQKPSLEPVQRRVNGQTVRIYNSTSKATAARASERQDTYLPTYLGWWSAVNLQLP